MGLTTKTLRELLEYKDTSRLELPEIQRDFVWQKRNVIMLFDSLYRRLPIGQMLVWKPKRAFPGKSFHGQKRRKAKGSVDTHYGFLLDGQQRLTAIARVREDDDRFPLMFDLWPEYDDQDYLKAPFYWRQIRENSSPWYVSVSDALEKDFDISAQLRSLEEDDEFEERHAEPVRKMLTQLQGILDYPISVIEYESDQYKDATELFIRFNSTGRKLNKTDLVLAELAMRVEGLTSREMGKVLGKGNVEFHLTRPFLMQCLAAVHTGRMRLDRPDQVFGDAEPKDILASWERTARGLEAVIDFITGTVRWDSGGWVPSFNAFIPLVYVLAHRKNWIKAEREMGRKWLLLAGVHAQFSGSVYTELDRILRKLKVSPTIEQLWETTAKKFRKISPDDFDTTNRSGPVMASFISMLRNHNGKDWVEDTPLDGSVIGQYAQLQVHHFFPRALLARHGYGPVDVNAFANLTILREDTNLDIGMEEPATYLDRIKYNKAELEKQCIPMDRKLWHVKNYEKFLDARKRLLAEGMNKFLGV
jgi:Protein of unknown function DUF262